MKKYLEPTATESIFRFCISLSGLFVVVCLASLGSAFLALFSLLLTLCLLWLFKRSLVLKNTGYPSSEVNYNNCKKAAVIYGWGIVSDIQMVRLEFETAASLGSWGELITIMFTPSGIQINSRPSPNKRPKLGGCSRIDQLNEQKVIDMLESMPFAPET
ncbi:hypothetical protein FV768_24815 [Vibrio parahaemolyticus]|uniref:hypothetical protein n=1 Tax=Vibrio parahaemolyticus TaxID=670 RepID=UPI0011237782|nr:hypothetical protein [Vibrio parahaemolyticus]EGQ9819126.1 hypothetical protein [Vibrio parahaemolyticus]EJE8521413.1 hypothetical protein [Vibrio parahaemolyticus]EJL6383515.1 hypothetical protein [Vibrio parahaemolyticus]ELA7007244.1 hypothetical protein [Vibrio parahaemolyticus]ELJ8875658.1 hypothetical protein [Vibrio parahaemolyticus]